VMIVILAAVSVGGGLLNRIRGGWQTVPQIPSDDDFTHDLFIRIIFGFGTAVFFFLFGGCRKVLVIPALVIALSTTLSLFVGWGTYFDMGRNPNGYLSRTGVFDWLVDVPRQNWDYTRRWIRDATGMALRGLLQSVPPGYVLYLYGFGPLYLVFGVAMAFIYEIAEDIPYKGDPDFSQGTPLAELLWVSTHLSRCCIKLRLMNALCRAGALGSYLV
jgi:hypothetical protein